MISTKTYGCRFIWPVLMLLLMAANTSGSNAFAMVVPAGRTAGGNDRSVQFKDLDKVLQGVMAEELGKDDAAYHFRKSDNGFEAVNGRQAVKAYINANAITIESGMDRWRIGLAGVAVPGGDRAFYPASRESLALKHQANRVESMGGWLRQWYVNSPLGVEQGWTITRPPKGGALALVLKTTGRFSINDDVRSLGLLSAAGAEVLRCGGLFAYDSDGKALPAKFERVNGKLRIKVDATGAKYPVVIDPYVQTAKLTASDGESLDSFGTSVFMSSDGSTVVAGAVGSIVGSNASQGAVYVFQKTGGSWTTGTQTAKLTASDGLPFDYLGNSVSVSSDGSTVVSGAWNAIVGSNGGQGAIYVFQKTGGGWTTGTQTAKLTASDGAIKDGLGSSVSLSSDGSTVVAGAWSARVGSNAGQGAVYVFQKTGGGWTTGTETAKLTASDGAVNDYFGDSVSVSSDGSAIVAGAPGAKVGSNAGQGAVYVFQKTGGGWTTGTQTAKLTASDGVAKDDLGYSVSVSSDGSAIAAGAAGARIGSNAGQGAVYVFQRNGGGWTTGTQTAKLAASDGSANDYLGNSVSISQDGSTVVAGAVDAKVGSNTIQGAVYVFQKIGGSWTSGTQTEKLTAVGGAAYDYLGTSVFVSSDGSTVVAGAMGAKVGSNSLQGAVYLFTNGSTLPAATLVSPTGTISTTTPAYTWNAVSTATWYYLWVSDFTGNKIQTWYTAAQAGCSSGTGTCSVTPATALAQGACQWWIQTWNSSGYGPWSNGMSFTISGILPGAATLVSPSGTISTNSPAYVWNSVPNASWYLLWVNDASTSPKIQQWFTASQAGCSSGTGTCSVTPATALAQGAGQWWIQTWNSSGYGPWSNGMSFLISGSLPGAATLISPSGTISTNSPAYVWIAVPNANWYLLWVNDASTSSKIQQWYTAAEAGCALGFGTCSVTPATALAQGACQWWIKTDNNSGQGPWSEGMSFIVP